MIYDRFDREVEQLEKLLEDGLITQEDFRREMKELRSDYRAAAEDAAAEAAQKEMDNWYPPY